MVKSFDVTPAVTLVEVSPRDGFQSVRPFIPTDLKIELVKRLHEAGAARIEATSFVSPVALPQLADAPEIVASARDVAGLDIQVLVPTSRHAERALAAGAAHLSFVLSVSEAHNHGNVRRNVAESIEDYRRIVAMRAPGSPMRLNLATAFDCPFEGRIARASVVALLEKLLALDEDVEIALCDTTGRASPGVVADVFIDVQARFPEVGAWAFHGHDTFGMGAANAWAAWQTGVLVFDGAAAGLGGCPFAPGATGNTATEDLVWMFEGGGIATGYDLDRLNAVAERIVELPGSATGGRVRDASRARASCSAVRAA